MSEPKPDPILGSPAPEFDLESTAGARVRLTEYRDGHALVLYVMREFT